MPSKRPAARPAPAAGGGEKLQKTYRTFMAARKKTGESTSNMNYDKVMRQFEKKIPDFKKRHKCKDVEFKVVIKDGKAKIKAVVAVMRKLSMALWHVAHGATFDSARLFDTRRLELGEA